MSRYSKKSVQQKNIVSTYNEIVTKLHKKNGNIPREALPVVADVLNSSAHDFRQLFLVDAHYFLLWNVIVFVFL